MTRIIPLSAGNSSNRPPHGGGFGTEAGPHGEGTQTNPHAENVIQFPSGRSFLPDSRAKSREPSIDLRELATCCFIGGTLALVAILFCIGFVGYRALIA